MAITVRELVTKLTIRGDAGAKLAKFGLAVDGVKAGLTILVGTVKAFSRASIGLVNDVTKVGDSIDKTSKSVGLSTKAFQRLVFAAERTGVPMTNLVKGLQNVQRNIRDAAQAARGGKKTGFTSALEEIGLRLDDLKGRTAEDTFGLIGGALNQVEDAGRRVALSQKLVGEEAGPKMASFLKEGQFGIEALGDEAERFGIIMDEDAIRASVEFQDSLTDLQAIILGVKRSVGVSLIPQMKNAVDIFTKWLLANREIIKQRMDKIVAALSRAFLFLLKNSTKIFKLFESSIVVMEKLIKFLIDTTDAVGGLENILKLAAVAFVAFKVVALSAMGPVGLAAGAILALAAAFTLVETRADRARKATKLFGDSQNEDVPVDKAQAKRDATSLAQALRRRGPLPNVLRRRLLTSSKPQLAEVLKLARRPFAGTPTFVGRAGIRAKEVVSSKADRESLRLLKIVIEDLAADRDRAASSEPSKEVDATLASLGIDGDDGLGGFHARTRILPGGDGGKGKNGKDGPTADDLVAQAIKAGTSPEVAALLTSTQPPIIIPITNNSFTISVEAPVTVTGVPGEQGEEFSERVVEIFRTEHILVIKDAFEQLRPRLVR